MTALPPCAIARRWFGTCARCGLFRRTTGVTVKSVRCDGLEFLSDPEGDLILWNMLGVQLPEESDAEPR